MVQQHPVTVAALTVWENVVLGGSGRIRRTHVAREVAELASSAGFDFDVTAPARALSIAAQQRLEILRAMHRRANILILDEPTAILAPEEARDLYAWLRRFADAGGTAIVITHKLDEAQKYTNALTVLRQGRTILESNSQAASRESLTQAMLGVAIETSSRAHNRDPRGGVLLRAKDMDVRDDRGVTSIKSASFEICAGEIVGVAGVEGSGHHHLLLAAAGRNTIDGGWVERPATVAFIPEDRHRDAVVLDFNLVENAAIHSAGSRRGRVNWRALRNEVANIVTRYDVRSPAPTAEMRVLSGGNQQKFVLGRELGTNPQLIVAENPTRGLDIRAASFVRDQLRAARARGAAVLVYSSDIDELIEIADRVLVVHAGKVSAEPANRERVGAAMLGAP
jgi:simple sugar transport system ATP-binding protein